MLCETFFWVKEIVFLCSFWCMSIYLLFFSLEWVRLLLVIEQTNVLLFRWRVTICCLLFLALNEQILYGTISFKCVKKIVFRRWRTTWWIVIFEKIMKSTQVLIFQKNMKNAKGEFTDADFWMKRFHRCWLQEEWWSLVLKVSFELWGSVWRIIQHWLSQLFYCLAYLFLLNN